MFISDCWMPNHSVKYCFAWYTAIYFIRFEAIVHLKTKHIFFLLDQFIHISLDEFEQHHINTMYPVRYEDFLGDLVNLCSYFLVDVHDVFTDNPQGYFTGPRATCPGRLRNLDDKGETGRKQSKHDTESETNMHQLCTICHRFPGRSVVDSIQFCM